MIVTRPLARGPASTATSNVRAASRGPAGRTRAVRARTRATNSASFGQPCEAREVRRIGSAVSWARARHGASDTMLAKAARARQRLALLVLIGVRDHGGW